MFAWLAKPWIGLTDFERNKVPYPDKKRSVFGNSALSLFIYICKSLLIVQQNGPTPPNSLRKVKHGQPPGGLAATWTRRYGAATG